MPSTEHHTFVGPSRDLEGLPSDYAAHLERLRDSCTFQGEVPMTDDERAVILRIHEAAGEIGDEIGVDIRSRLPKLEWYHFFPDRDTYDVAIGGRWPNETLAGRGKNHPEVGIMWARRARENENNSGLAHELGHEVSQQRVEPVLTSVVVDGDTTTNSLNIKSACGYTKFKENGTCEWVTDLWTNRLMRRANLGDTLLGFAPLDALGDAIMRRTAELTGHTPAEIDTMLLVGNLTGDMQGLRLVTKAIGTDGMRRMVNLTGHESFDDAIAIAQELNLPDAVAMLTSLRDGKPTTVFAWHPEGPAANTATTTAAGNVDPGLPGTAAAVTLGVGLAGVQAETSHAIHIAEEVNFGLAAVLAGFDVAVEQLYSTADGSPALQAIAEQVSAARRGLEQTRVYIEEGRTHLTGYLGAIGVDAP
ncbi:MAG TPA: hypothetical protein VLH86_00170 [Patescibacteria group bacterium]|nr:hypothetical protein [Patescibacteria group bacterium]